MSHRRHTVHRAEQHIPQPARTEPLAPTPLSSQEELLDERRPLEDTARIALPRPEYFDLQNVVPVVSGVETELLGSGSSVSTNVVPYGYRALIYLFQPYLEDAAGPVTSMRIPGAGVSIIWKLFAGNEPVHPYESLRFLLGPVGNDEPLVEIAEARRLRVTVTPTDPVGLYTQVGIRVQGRIVRVSTRRRRK